MYQLDGYVNPGIFSTMLKIRRPSSECYMDFGRIFADKSVGDRQSPGAHSDTWASVFRHMRRCACVLCRQSPANKR